MRMLTIFRHARAERAEQGTEDFERRLDRKGRAEAKEMADRLVALDYRPDHLLTSSAVRTVETARILAEALAFPAERICQDDRLYLAEVQQLHEVLAQCPATASHVLLVGHNPGLSLLASRLHATADVGELPTAAAITFELPINSWSALVARSGRCRLYAIPGQPGHD